MHILWIVYAETTLHLFCLCHEVEQFWVDLASGLCSYLKFNVQFRFSTKCSALNII